MSEKMRDEFKGWAYKSGYDIDDAQESADDEKFFVCYDTEACWQAWQASRAALVVELPKAVHINISERRILLEGDVTDALDSSGISYK